MKIIDLLNKIAKGEEVPKEIIVDNKKFQYNKTYEQYHDKYEVNLLEHISDYNYSGLNDEIEEVEDKGYEDIEDTRYMKHFEGNGKCYVESKGHKYYVPYDLLLLIDALIRNQKYILEQLKNK